MKAGSFGILSAGFASACCGLPLLLVALGLGGLGLGSFIGAYHVYFVGAGVVLLAVAWFVFLREKKRLYAAGREIRNAGKTAAILGLATVAVAGFGALNLYSSLGLGDKAAEVARATPGPSSGDTAQAALEVEGMTCFTCEITVEKALGSLTGIINAKASASAGKVLVRYRPGRVTFDQMREAIDRTGYKAKPPAS
jgi:mercuric ion transport protein